MAPLIATKAAVWMALIARNADVRCAVGMTAARGTVSASLQTGCRSDVKTFILHAA